MRLTVGAVGINVARWEASAISRPVEATTFFGTGATDEGGGHVRRSVAHEGQALKCGLMSLIAIASSCTGERAPPFAEMRPTWTGDAAWVIEPQSTLRLGSVDDDSTEIFVDVSQAILLPQGRIAVADNGMGSVRVFDAEGRLLVSFGK